MAVENKLDIAIDELEYALKSDDKNNRVYYITNAIRFIAEVKEELYKNQ